MRAINVAAGVPVLVACIKKCRCTVLLSNVERKPYVQSGDSVGGTCVVQPNFAAENNAVQNVMVVAVDLNRSCRWSDCTWRAKIVIKVGFTQPGLQDHHLVSTVYLDTVLAKVKQVPGGLR